ncbi:hypothetical protein ONZ45_g15720 [Pleurotus djamor]|nr:hypothetical protein ONZ45_g15720 [Pleurotus djamor]
MIVVLVTDTDNELSAHRVLFIAAPPPLHIQVTQLCTAFALALLFSTTMITPVKEDEAQREASQNPPQPYPPPYNEPTEPPQAATSSQYPTASTPQHSYPPPGTQSPYGYEPNPSSPPRGYPQPQSSPYPSSFPERSPMDRDVELGRQYQAAMYARCAQGMHDPTTKYGACGIIAAILLFPIGLIFLW